MGNQNPARQSPYDRRGGFQYTTINDNGTLASAHEFGHAMGLGDEYWEGPRNPDGTRNVQLKPGQLMGDTSANARPTPANFNSLITGQGLLR